MLERKFEKSRFASVDSDVIDRLIGKEDEKKEELTESKKDILKSLFQTQMPKMEKMEFNVDAQAMGESAAPVVITQSEYMRRMKDMSRIQQGMGFYGEMPDMQRNGIKNEKKKDCGLLRSPI